MSRSIELKSYRQRKMAELGPEEFKRQEALKRKQRRQRKQIEEKKEPSGQESCETLIDAIYQAKLQSLPEGKSIKKTSVKQQVTRVENLYKSMKGDNSNCIDYEWLREKDAVFKFITNNTKYKPETKNAQLQAISSILSVLDGFENEYDFYSKASTRGRKAITEEAKESILTPSELSRFVKWSTLKDIYKKVTNLKEQALMAIYTLIPPRRLKDFQLMKITTSTAREAHNLDSEFNYISITNVIKKPKQLIFNNYKTNKQYKQQIFEVPPVLRTVLSKYIRSSDLKDGEFLFGRTHTDVDRAFSTTVSGIFKKYTSKAVSINILRHSFISDFISKPNISTRQKEEVATFMAHSLAVQESYRRINTPS
jgi:hypothetical protein